MVLNARTINPSSLLREKRETGKTLGWRDSDDFLFRFPTRTKTKNSVDI